MVTPPAQLAASCSVFGLFRVSNARRGTNTNRKTGRTSTYYDYDTDIVGVDGINWPAELRHYPGHNVNPFEEHTILLVYAHLTIPETGSRIGLLNAITVFPISGNPQDEAYDTPIPEMPALITAVGHVRGNGAMLGDDVTRVYTLATAEYCRDSVVPFRLSFGFNTSLPRWANPPVPAPGTCIQVAGNLGYVTDDALFGIVVQHLTPNLAPLANAGAGNDDDGESPSKKRKLRSSSDRTVPVAKTPTRRTGQPAPTPSTPIDPPPPSSSMTTATHPIQCMDWSPSPLPQQPPAQVPPLRCPPLPAQATAPPAPPIPALNLPIPATPSLNLPLSSSVPPPPATANRGATPGPSQPRNRNPPTRGRRNTPSVAAPIPVPDPATGTGGLLLPPLSTVVQVAQPGLPPLPRCPAPSTARVVINEPSAHLTPRQKEKRPDESIHPDFMD